MPCEGTGQDGEFRRGVSWPVPRFALEDDCVHDRLTGLRWTRNANLAEFPLTWPDALEFVAGLNRHRAIGFSDWRLPNRKELRSLMSMATRRPALPLGHPFSNVFLGWYWTSTTAAINPAYAWSIHMDGARMFYAEKERYCLLWPVRGDASGVLPATGQVGCFDAQGRVVSCGGTGQDGELRSGFSWPSPRFEAAGDTAVVDRLSGLLWLRRAWSPPGPVNWWDALERVRKTNEEVRIPGLVWRLPNINELESLVDCSRHSPALPAGHPFLDVADIYWSSTTSFFDPAWAWALYLHKGAVGVGFKAEAAFSVWPVADAPRRFGLE